MTSNRRRKAVARAHQRATGAPYSVARRRVRTLDDVLAEHPLLNEYGFGVPDARHKTPDERTAELRSTREQLRQHRSEVEAVCDWMVANLAPIKTPTRSSYGLKHTAERAMGGYVSNGQLIAAAIMAGYPISRPEGPNVLVAVSKRDLNRVRAEEPDRP